MVKFTTANKNEQAIELAKRDANLKPSDFLRSLGITSGSWLCFGTVPEFPLEEMDQDNFYLTGEEPAGFCHPDITIEPGCIPWTRLLLLLDDGSLLMPESFVKTKQGHAVKAIRLNTDSVRISDLKTDWNSLLWNDAKKPVESFLLKDLLEKDCKLVIGYE